MDSVQLVLLFVIVVLAIMLVLLGVQVFFILMEIRRTVMKANKLLDNADTITQSIQGPLSAFSSIALGFKATSFIAVAKIIKSLLGKEEDSHEGHHHHKE